MKNKSIISLMIGLVLFSNSFAQQENNKDQALRGSGRVNSSTLAMEFDLPLGSYPGRGIDVPVSLSYSSKLWRAEYINSQPRVNVPEECIAMNIPRYAEDSAAGWTTSLATPYVEYVGGDNLYDGAGSPAGSSICSDKPDTDTYLAKRIVAHLPGGETHELVATDSVVSYNPQNPAAGIWNDAFYAIDGSNIRYVENSDNNTYKLLMPDGSFYEFANNQSTHQMKTVRKAAKFTDRNGNYTAYQNGVWTDTLGRALVEPFGLSAPGSPGTFNYSMPGMSGQYKFRWKNLKGATAAESALGDFNAVLKYKADRASASPTGTPRSGQALFYSGSAAWVHDAGTGLFNPVVLSEIELPTGQIYQFKYDVFGRIERIDYPTGGQEQFTYSVVEPLTQAESDNVSDQMNFGVTNRKVYRSSADTQPYEWSYAAGEVNAAGYKVTITAPDGTRTERYLYRGWAGIYGFSYGLTGMVYESRGYDAQGHPLSKEKTQWEMSTFSVPDGSLSDHRHPRVIQKENYIFDESGNGIYSTTEYEYEGDLTSKETPLLSKTVKQYAFAVAGNAPPAAPVRTSETTYLINDPSVSNGQSYKDRNMIGLATASVVKDAAGNVVSRSEMKYDESGYSPADYVRGNPTTSRVWDSTKGAVTNPTAYIAARAKFDAYGNRYEAIDAKGNATVTTFDATHHVFPLQVTSAVPDPSNTYGSNTAFVTTATFDPVTGLPLSTTDANGLETRIEYDPVTLRPKNTKTFYQNTQIGGMSETIYHDEPNNYWVKSRTQIDQNRWAESIAYFDGLGRNYKAEEINSEGNIFVEKEFDEDGRVKRVTNPYRANEIKIWTTNVYDQASRIKEVVLPDGAKVKTDYGVAAIGNQIGETETITDQAGKKSRSITNAFDELIRVDEPNSDGNLGTIDNPLQATYYDYDALGEMIKVKQGLQERFFMYNSLGRLLRVRQPEQNINTALNTSGNPENNQWSVGFTYDDNENILTLTTAKGVLISYSYDNLNRLLTRTYSDGTPQVVHKYDNLPNGKGKLIEVVNSISTSKTIAFDDLGRPSSYQQITDGQVYASSYQYNLAGSLVSETYPSGKQVGYEYNSNSDLTRVWGQTGQVQKTYANSFGYSATGAVERLRLGNGKWETIQANNRLQPIQLGLG